MTDKNYEVVDREYGEIPRKGSARQIKTRTTSFDKIRSFFNSIRLERLKKKLDKKVDQALTQGYSNENYEKKLTKNANIIARLEEKIMILSGEEVPTNYVSRRAIKLRESMASNLTFNAGFMYSVGLENRDAVLNSGLADEEPVEVPIVENPVEVDSQASESEERDAVIPDAGVLAAAAPSENSDGKIDVASGDLDRKEIENIINSTFDGIKEDAVNADVPASDSHKEGSAPVDGEMSEVDRQEVRDAINEAFDAMNATNAPTTDAPVVGREEVREAVNEAFDTMNATNTPVTDTPVVGREEVREAVNEAFDAMNATNTPVTNTPVVGREEVREAVNEAFDSVDKSNVDIPVVEEPVIEASVVDKATTDAAIDSEVDKAIERIRISRNNSSAINSSQFDEDGNRRERRKKYNYTPMTDEEIRQSQIKLGFDEHGNLIDNGTQKPREEVVSTAKIIGNFVAPGVIPNISLSDVFVPAAPIPDKQKRDIPIVVPDRDDSTFDLEMDDNQSLFEIIDPPVDSTEEEYHVADTATVEDPSVQSTGEMSLDDYNALKEKILYLQQQKRITYQQKVDAQKAAEESAADARSARRMYEISQANYNERMQRLRAYTEALEADCDENVRSAAEAESNARRNSDFAQAQREMVDANIRIIGEIDSMIGSADLSDGDGPKVR